MSTMLLLLFFVPVRIAEGFDTPTARRLRITRLARMFVTFAAAMTSAESARNTMTVTSLPVRSRVASAWSRGTVTTVAPSPYFASNQLSSCVLASSRSALSGTVKWRGV